MAADRSVAETEGTSTPARADPAMLRFWPQSTGGFFRDLVRIHRGQLRSDQGHLLVAQPDSSWRRDDGRLYGMVLATVDAWRAEADRRLQDCEFDDNYCCFDSTIRFLDRMDTGPTAPARRQVVLAVELLDRG